MAQEKEKEKAEGARAKHSLLDRPQFIAVALAGLVIGVLLITGFIRARNDAFSMCSTARATAKNVAEYSATPIELRAIVHYATSRIVPQQTFREISVTLNVLKNRSPCNFLVFGLGHDSLMWASLNPRGTTVFLEEDLGWISTVLESAPSLRAHHIKYRTQLAQAGQLLAKYRGEPSCLPAGAYPIRYNEECQLALTSLPDEIYETEWDLIMIDAPKGYYAKAPGRMAAIFSSAVMARNRKTQGTTHVFLHDVDRRVEKSYAEEFLCRNFLVNSAGRLWHFEIPNAANMSAAPGDRFC